MGEESTPENYTLLQGFEWNCPADGKHYDRLKAQIPALKDIGISNLWLPPACKASSPEGNGYDIYDLYDLGEFDQKGSVRTKWGDKEALLALCKTAREAGINTYLDAVLNHKAGADKKEKCHVIEVDADNRNKEVSDRYEITAWLGFDFPGRGDNYSKMKYHWYHFSGTDYDAGNNRNAIFKIASEGKSWSETVSDESGNADFLMFADIDYSHEEVQEDVKRWGAWVVKELGLKGFRLDAVQHFSQRFTNEWIESVNKDVGEKLFYVGEYWDGEAQNLCNWLDETEHKMSLYDSPLLNKFASLSKEEKGDLRKIFDGSLVAVKPVNAVTVVQNHDTQKGQTVETPVEGWMKPLAHSLILLRQEGYPCVFYGDLYGIKGDNAEPPSCGDKLADIIAARKHYAYGDQNDYFDNANCIGFVRRGTKDRPDGLACVMSNADPGEIQMHVGPEHKGEVWTDILGWQQDQVTIDDEGNGVFKTPGVSVSIWVKKDAQHRDKFPVNFDSDIYKS
ncbi:putative alpha-amylase [Elsinoe ampelina]|uniref:Putative alpha-amylase n=1 Tax=Elsinoe ampelina TaxID=302913 RepID=A0A6A6GMS3_9PEZI|nr:putative alpha-amylase [Elsinoe ampelina]